MGHPIRIKIIETLLENEKCVSNIWGCLDLPQATVSQHLPLACKGDCAPGALRGKVKYSICDRNIGEIVKLIKERELT